MRRWAALAAVAAAALIASRTLDDYQVYVSTQICLAAMVALGLVLLSGVAGLTSFGQASLVGIAAYTAAVGATRFGLSPWETLPLAVALTAGAACLTGAVTVGLSGHYLPLCTLAWGLAFATLFGTLDGLGHFEGIGHIAPLSIGGHVISGGEALVLATVLFLILLVLCWNLLDSREGRALRALEAGRLMAECMGVNSWRSRLAVFVIAAIFAAVAGWFYAHLQRFVNPSPFGLDAGIEYLFMALLGGASSLWGALIGAFSLIWAREWLKRLLPLLLGRPGDFDIVVFSAGLILLLQFAPRGLVGRFTRAAPPPRLHPAAARLPSRPRAAPGTPLLVASGLDKRFGGLVANHDVGLSLAAGEVVAVIGPNGAGKSTLFDLLTGVQPADAGRVILRGTPIIGRRARDITALGLSRTFQHVRLVPGMSVLENIALGAHRRGRAGLTRAMLRLDRAEDRALLAEAARQAARCGLAAYLDRPAGDLPLGLQRIVEVARALAGDPAVLLLDEPAAGLRAAEKRALATLLGELRAQGLGILLVEHDMGFVMALADRVMVMNFGTLLASGTPAEIQSDPRVLAAYLGAAA
jgi:branched-chain amino acid transport system permease protein